MEGWELWDGGILLVAAYIAVVTLVRMMARRRDKLLDDLSKGAEQQHRRKSKPAADGKRGEAA
jgi:hypothetical protein